MFQVPSSFRDFTRRGGCFLRCPVLGGAGRRATGDTSLVRLRFGRLSTSVVTSSESGATGSAGSISPGFGPTCSCSLLTVSIILTFTRGETYSSASTSCPSTAAIIRLIGAKRSSICSSVLPSTSSTGRMSSRESFACRISSFGSLQCHAWIAWNFARYLHAPNVRATLR